MYGSVAGTHAAACRVCVGDGFNKKGPGINPGLNSLHRECKLAQVDGALLSFESSEAYPVDSWLALRMILLPAPLGLALPVRVLRCDRNDRNEGWTLAVNFDVLTDAQRQLLARHILQKQAQEIRAAKSTERNSE